MNKKLCITIVILFLNLCFVPNNTLENQKRDVSHEDIEIILSQPIPMRDGILVSAKIWKPANSSNPLPIILSFTPYISDNHHRTGSFYARHGYIFVSVDVRGRGASQGIYAPLEGVQISRDIVDAIEWLSLRPWSNGQFGMEGGSYLGMVQWQALKNKPEKLMTIIPSVSIYPGIDFPMRNNIFYLYAARWLAGTCGRTGNDALFGDVQFWKTKYLKQYHEYIPSSRFWEIAGIPSEIYLKWIEHPVYDEYWSSCVPAPDDYRDIDIPILTITGHYDSDQLGALSYYKEFMKCAGEQAKKNHFLLIGPWDHSLSSKNFQEPYGYRFGENSDLDIDKLSLDWFDWVFEGKTQSSILKNKINYYVMGKNVWKHTNSLDRVYNEKKKLYLGSINGLARDIFHSGYLSPTLQDDQGPDSFRYDPLDTSPREYFNLDIRSFLFRHINNLYCGDKLIYHSMPLNEALEVSGFMRLRLYISLDVPDTDLKASVFEVKPDGQSIFLAWDILRARFRNSIRNDEFAKPGEINLYKFENFNFISRLIGKDSRMRLVIEPLNSPEWQKNYNAGGIVAFESNRDARTAVITVYHDQKYPSHLELPVWLEK